MRSIASTRYGAKSWNCQRSVAARIGASTLGLDIRHVVTSLTKRSANCIYCTLYGAGGQSENMIKRRKI